jgi:hypothetical protein
MKNQVKKNLLNGVERVYTERFLNPILAKLESFPDRDELEPVFRSAIVFAYFESWEIITVVDETIRITYNVDGERFYAQFGRA